ncbi:unnamed protein product [Acanthoscelides obtectus]|uniref:Uncharacterized protein n=1 Tax=Acanthoscelides obtectus TaxID=200917 RepID=A0A9P0MFD9_ACAOB|nr:unnamed protein product [Acanthoscelides obtectus]CAK1661016.1 hypothetical protein AOBTE_LOCUS22385 [Acanthoscelides obtectus]
MRSNDGGQYLVIWKSIRYAEGAPVSWSSLYMMFAAMISKCEKLVDVEYHRLPQLRSNDYGSFNFLARFDKLVESEDVSSIDILRVQYLGHFFVVEFDEVSHVFSPGGAIRVDVDQEEKILSWWAVLDQLEVNE